MHAMKTYGGSEISATDGLGYLASRFGHFIRV